MNLDDRMKALEGASGPFLLRRCPAIIRIDGRAFHTFTKGFNKSFDFRLHNSMIVAAQSLMSDIGGTAILAYTQSDECSILLNDTSSLDSEHWFAGKTQKIASVASSIFTLGFNGQLAAELTMTTDGSVETNLIQKLWTASFDARCFSIPESEVGNYLKWRQFDAMRNSIAGLAQQNFSAKALHGKNRTEQLLMLHEHGIDWEDSVPEYRYGTYIFADESLASYQWNQND